ncbi:hypothetical protein [Rhizobium ecuadorense]|uniref:hypothetical protein n=1 Tax=Rhizobium ecuadorense TaxID=1671795 RepID=UPI00128EAD11|nr:hypothetical protein [Rhizobium ecuadorense]
MPHIPQSSAYRAIEIFKGIDPELFPHWGNISNRALAEVAQVEPDIQALIAERIEAGEIFTAARVKGIQDGARLSGLIGGVKRIRAAHDGLRQGLVVAEHIAGATNIFAANLPNGVAEVVFKIGALPLFALRLQHRPRHCPLPDRFLLRRECRSLDFLPVTMSAGRLDAF